jgi:hypothetical protein
LPRHIDLENIDIVGTRAVVEQPLAKHHGEMCGDTEINVSAIAQMQVVRCLL